MYFLENPESCPLAQGNRVILLCHQQIIGQDRSGVALPKSNKAYEKTTLTSLVKAERLLNHRVTVLLYTNSQLFAVLVDSCQQMAASSRWQHSPLQRVYPQVPALQAYHDVCCQRNLLSVETSLHTFVYKYYIILIRELTVFSFKSFSLASERTLDSDNKHNIYFVVRGTSYMVCNLYCEYSEHR